MYNLADYCLTVPTAEELFIGLGGLLRSASAREITLCSGSFVVTRS